MKKFNKLCLALVAGLSLTTIFAGCLSLPTTTTAQTPASNEINKVTFCDPNTSVDGSKSFTLKIDEVDASGNVLESNVIFPTMVTFSATYHQREFNVKGKILPGKIYKVGLTSANDATPILITNSSDNTFTAAGGYDYRIEYYGKSDSGHNFKIAKVLN